MAEEKKSVENNNEKKKFSFYLITRVTGILIFFAGIIYLGNLGINYYTTANNIEVRPLLQKVEKKSEVEPVYEDRNDQNLTNESPAIVENTDPVAEKTKQDEPKIIPENSIEKSKEISPEITPKTKAFAMVDKTVYIQNKGPAFVHGLTKSLNHELNDKFLGWRPNDISANYLSFISPDNVKNYQLGVLSVTKSATQLLMNKLSIQKRMINKKENIEEAISFIKDNSMSEIEDNLPNLITSLNREKNKNLEEAIALFSTPPDKLSPSAVEKYNEGIEKIDGFLDDMKKRESFFVASPENLIATLNFFDEILKSIEDNLTAEKNEENEDISTFDADDSFYNAQGQLTVILYINRSLKEEFYKIIERKKCLNTFNTVTDSLRLAINIEPFIVTNGDIDGFLANHRTNLSTLVSKARFHMNVLIYNLSSE